MGGARGGGQERGWARRTEGGRGVQTGMSHAWANAIHNVHQHLPFLFVPSSHPPLCTLCAPPLRPPGMHTLVAMQPRLPHLHADDELLGRAVFDKVDLLKVGQEVGELVVRARACRHKHVQVRKELGCGRVANGGRKVAGWARPALLQHTAVKSWHEQGGSCHPNYANARGPGEAGRTCRCAAGPSAPSS